MQNFCTIVWLLAVCGVVVMSTAGAKRAMACLLICVLVCPVLSIGALTIRMELVTVPLLFGLVVVSGPQKLLGAIRQPASMLAGGWLAWVIVASLASGGWHLLGRFSWWLELYGLARLTMVFWLFAMPTWSSAEIIVLIRLFAITAIPACILSIGQVLNWGWARSLSWAGYVPSTSPVFQQQLEKEEGGYVFRALGFFGNVSPNAYYFAIVAGCCVIALLDGRARGLTYSRLLWLMCGGLSLLGGISTMSGTFVAGLPMVLLLCLWLSRRHLSPRRMYLLLGIVILAFVTTLALVHAIPRLKVQYDYQVEGLLSGERFKSRYDDETGVTLEAKSVIAENPLIGGFGREENVFVGDSILTPLGFYGGYIGAALFSLFVAMLYYRANRRDLPKYGTLWLLGALLFGASTTSVFTLRMADWWWALMGIFSACSLKTGAGSQANGRAVRASQAEPESLAEFGGIGNPGSPRLKGPVSL